MLRERSPTTTTHTTNPDSTNDEEHTTSVRALAIELTEATTTGNPTPFTTSQPDDTDGPTTTAAGTTALLTTATLPGHPPPPLLTPTTSKPRQTLTEWTTNTPYPAAPRPTTPVRTW